MTHEWLKVGNEWQCVKCYQRMINVANLEDAPEWMRKGECMGLEVSK